MKNTTRKRKKALRGFEAAYGRQELIDQMYHLFVRGKQGAVGRRRAGSPSELLSVVRGFLCGRQRQPNVVSRYFHKDSVQYAAI